MGGGEEGRHSAPTGYGNLGEVIFHISSGYNGWSSEILSQVNTNPLLTHSWQVASKPLLEISGDMECPGCQRSRPHGWMVHMVLSFSFAGPPRTSPTLLWESASTWDVNPQTQGSTCGESGEGWGWQCQQYSRPLGSFPFSCQFSAPHSKTLEATGSVCLIHYTAPRPSDTFSRGSLPRRAETMGWSHSVKHRRF